MTTPGSSAWLFEEWPAGSFYRESQVLSTAFLRLQVVAAFRPARRVLRWFVRR